MKRRKKAGAMVLAVMLALMPVRVLGGGADTTAGEIEVTARAAVAMEAETGRVLYEKNADEVLPMASTTKVMTALVVLENAELDDRVEIDGRMAGIEGSSMNLDAGEELTVEQLLYGLMLRSGNDAAVALAIHVAGSVEGFAEKMNAKAAEMGLMHTHFCNPHGLPAQGHETTARELARIAAEAWKHEEFRRIVGTKSVTVPWKGRDYDRAMKNKNRLLTLLPRRQRHQDRVYEGGGAVPRGRRGAGRDAADHGGAERAGHVERHDPDHGGRVCTGAEGTGGAGGGDLRVGSACMGRRDAGCGGGERVFAAAGGREGGNRVDSARNHRKRGCSRAEFGVC